MILFASSGLVNSTIIVEAGFISTDSCYPSNVFDVCIQYKSSVIMEELRFDLVELLYIYRAHPDPMCKNTICRKPNRRASSDPVHLVICKLS